jgi:imidazolonepropionase-like amidohydrolase
MKYLMQTTGLVAASFLASAAFAQDLIHKAPPQEGPILIRNATIHTVHNGVIFNGALLFSDGVIETVMSEENFSNWLRTNRNGSFEEIDAAGMHVYPGLINAVSNVGLTEIGAVPVTNDSRELGSWTPEARAVASVNPDSTHIPVARANGILIAGAFPSGGTIQGRPAIIRMDGWTWEDMAVDADAGVSISWPSMIPFRSAFIRTSEADQLKRSKETLASINEFFDRAEAYAEAKANDSGQETDLRLEAMLEVVNGRKPVFINANELEQIISAVNWASERGLKAIIVGGRDAYKCADTLNRHNVPVVLSGTLNQPSRRDLPYDEAYSRPKMLDDAGVTWCLSAGGSSAVRNLPYHAGMGVAFGLDPDSAIRSITLSAAEILGIDDRYGSLESGKSATLIITDGDPLDIRTGVHMAFIDGRKVDLRSKHTQLNEKYREKYRQLGYIEK